MSLSTIAAALIRANRWTQAGELFEDFDLGTAEGISALAARAVAILTALRLAEIQHELHRLPDESTSD